MLLSCMRLRVVQAEAKAYAYQQLASFAWLEELLRKFADQLDAARADSSKYMKENEQLRAQVHALQTHNANKATEMRRFSWED
ncbi:MAG: hypothetical protein H6850_03355 [Alphaproteobacteria bacterium]|nr:MAG: hypothetical protein H6850_03355 [Alphaproteobacteria bacterium]